MMKTNLLTVLGICSLAALAGAQSFSYPDFSSTSGLALNGNATTAGTALRLTGNTLSEKGSVFYTTAVPVDGGFDTTFTFQITGLSGGGGDGIAFVIQNDPDGTAALGDHASAMGYGAFASSPTTNAVGNSLVLEIDTYGGGWGDPNGNHLSVHTNGSADNTQDESVSIGLVSPATNLSDGQPHAVRLRYAPGQLDLYLDDLVNPVITMPYDIVTGGTWTAGGTVGGLALMGGSTAYVGFTAGNGAAVENHDILSWDWQTGAGVATFCTSVPTSLAGCTAVMTGSGPSVSKSAGAGSYTLSLGPAPGGPQAGVFIWSKSLLATPVFKDPNLPQSSGGGFGWRCIQPTRGTPDLPGGNTGICNGQYDWDLGAYVSTAGVILVGDDLYCQGWFRDPGLVSGALFTRGVGPIAVTP